MDSRANTSVTINNDNGKVMFSPHEDNTDDSEITVTPESTLRGSGSDHGYLGDDDDESLEYKERDRLLIRQSTHSVEVKNVVGNVGIFKQASFLSSTKKVVFGIFIVVVIATSWVGSTQTAQSTYDGKFRAPFFLVWFKTSWMLLVFPVTVPLYFIINKKTVNQETINELWSHSQEVITPSTFHPVSLLTSTVLFTLIWIPTNYMYDRALISIAATDVTAIFSTAPAFVFIFSMIILREPPLLLRFFAVLLSISGIVLFAYVDGFGTANTWSIALSIGSAIGAALYKTLLKWRVKEASLFQMAFFLSTIGLFTLLVFWPLVVLLHFTHAEILVDVPWSYLCGSSILGVLFNFAINFGIAYTFPLFISLGTIMGIPLNALLDAVIRHVDLANWKITAMDLVIGGFLLMLVPPSTSLWIEGKLCCKRCQPNKQLTIQ